MGIQDLYGARKSELIDLVSVEVKNKVSDIGIIIDQIYLIGSFRLPILLLRH